MTDKNNAANPEAHPLPWTALPADKADLFEGADMWFFNDADGEEVFYGCAMSAEVRDLILEAVNGTALLSNLRAAVADERAAESHFEDELERAYWEMDARIKGLGNHKGRPQPDRDAFKWAVRGMQPMPPKPAPEYICICCNIPRNNCDCAALASAPVAGEAVSRDSVLKEVAGFIRGTNWIAEEEPIGDLIARHVLSMAPCAAPQASEAARDAKVLIEKLEAWQAVCDRIVDQYGGVVAGVDFAALGRANRAALSAQPGAQKTGGGDA
ncbi:hypothetical protein ACFWP0_09330 [Achromobacter sp. NPDC058515]|uniref:hypothetical protein n=1 Tax=Achromobacter sp. NPDC058515 TaxID=3346533 RepID=UPI0036484C93